MKRQEKNKLRDSGHSIINICGHSGWPAPRMGKHLNGPVVVIKEGVVVETVHEVDPRRYASQNLRKKVLHRDGFRCRYCGREVANSNANIDHVIPWREGGKNTMANLVACCQECNKAKGNRRWKPRKR